MRSPSTSPSAFSLVEVTLALAIATFCLITIFALLPVGLASNKEAVEQTSAMNVLSAVAADLHSTVASGTSTVNSTRFGISVPAVPSAPAITTSTNVQYSYISEDGQPSSTNSNAKYLLHVWITTPAPSSYKKVFPPPVQTINVASKSATQARLLLTWPAQANYLSPVGSAETIISLDRN